MPDLVPLSGSERMELAGAAPASAPLDDSQEITVTLMLRRRAEVPRALVEGPETVSPAELGEQYGASEDDARQVTEVLGQYGLTVTEAHLASRRLKVSGTIPALQSAFGTRLSAVTSPHPDGTGTVQHRYRTGSLSVPAPLDGIVTAVLGLDDRPQARAQFRRGRAATARRPGRKTGRAARPRPPIRRYR